MRRHCRRRHQVDAQRVRQVDSSHGLRVRRSEGQRLRPPRAGGRVPCDRRGSPTPGALIKQPVDGVFLERQVRAGCGLMAKTFVRDQDRVMRAFVAVDCHGHITGDVQLPGSRGRSSVRRTPPGGTPVVVDHPDGSGASYTARAGEAETSESRQQSEFGRR